ncbi:MAG: LPS assembly protein LptD, partial [Candidatus Aminicenantes bacterium]|nr:LPS assembly protein LptD [Candidatus Aminicenantes bacterium]
MIIPTRLSARRIGVVPAFLILLCLCATRLPAQEKAASELKASGARIQADKIDQKGDIVSAWGRVRVFYGDLILLANHVDINTATKDALADGQVSLRLPKEVLTAETMMVNLDTALGSMQGAFGLLQPSLYFSSERMERESEVIYKMGRSRFTTCSQAVPRWSVSCAKATMRKDDYLEMWGVTFSVKKVPVFYLPYMKYPLAQERATGFLFPQIGFSGVKGFSLSQSFYWAIARNQDATFSLDYYGAKGMGGGLEYRYIFGSPDKAGAAGLFGGEARVYYFAFRTEEDGTKRDDAYLVRWNHNQTLPGGFILTAAVNYQTSFDFLREFDNDFKRAVIFNRSSQVYLSRTWGGLSLSARASQFETNFQGVNNAIVSRSLPQISLSLSRTKILGPLGFSMSAGYNNWEYGWQSQFDTGTQLKNKTITFFPSLSVPWASIPWLTANASISGNLQYFFLSKD